MNHETAVWILLSCLVAAALVGFAAAWILQAWRMRTGSRIAADLQEAYSRLQAAHEHLGISAEHERAARVAADQRVRALNETRSTPDADMTAQLEQVAQLTQANATLQATCDRQTAECRQLEDRVEALVAQLQVAEAFAAAPVAADHTTSDGGPADQPLALAEAEAALAEAETALAEARQAERALAAEVEQLAARAREVEQLREQHGHSAERVLTLEQTINRMQIEALARDQELAAAQKALTSLPPSLVAPGDDDLRIARQLDQQRLQELEEALRKARQAASDGRIEISGLKARVRDLESTVQRLAGSERDTVSAP